MSIVEPRNNQSALTCPAWCAERYEVGQAHHVQVDTLDGDYRGHVQVVCKQPPDADMAVVVTARRAITGGRGIEEIRISAWQARMLTRVVEYVPAHNRQDLVCGLVEASRRLELDS